MPVEIRAILDFFRDYTGRIMIALGAFLILISFLFLTRVYQWVSFFSFSIGATMIIVGFALHFESFKWKVPSIGGVGTILVYVSFVFMTAAVVTAFFAVPIGATAVPAHGSSSAIDEHGSPIAWVSRTSNTIKMWLERPSAWLATPLMIIGLGLLALGFLLRFASDAF